MKPDVMNLLNDPGLIQKSEMKALVFGAGNIGRGFIGRLLFQSAYELVFVEVRQDLIDLLNRRKRYPVRIVRTGSSEDVWIENVRAVHIGDIASVADEIASCDILATAVGVNVLQDTVPALLAGIRQRFQITRSSPLNIIICENLLHADEYLRILLLSGMSPTEVTLFDCSVGLVEASIGCMVPIMTEEQKLEDPLLLRVEPYQALPVDKAAFLGPIPAIAGLVPFEPFDFYTQRKLFVHNLGHAVCAYLGLYRNLRCTWESMADPWLYLCVQNAMLESAAALSREYAAFAIDMPAIVANIDDLLLRFQNKALEDTNERVAADPARKLRPDDRFVGAAKIVLRQGGQPVFIALGIASAIHKLRESRPADTRKILAVQGGLPAAHPVIDLVEDYLGMLARGIGLEGLFSFAEQTRARFAGPDTWRG